MAVTKTGTPLHPSSKKQCWSLTESFLPLTEQHWPGWGRGAAVMATLWDRNCEILNTFCPRLLINYLPFERKTSHCCNLQNCKTSQQHYIAIPHYLVNTEINYIQCFSLFYIFINIMYLALYFPKILFKVNNMY